MNDYQRTIDVDDLWPTILREAGEAFRTFPLLADFYRRNILDHHSFNEALAWQLADKLADDREQLRQWQQWFLSLMEAQPAIGEAALTDLLCQLQSNASIKDHYSPLLHFGGYQALQAHRMAHACWSSDRRAMAGYIQGRAVSLWGVDIHPGAVFGAGIFIDHAVGIVVGETTVVEDDVTLFQSVTLGGTAKGSGDRHPKVRRGAFIGSGAVILGNIEVGAGARVGAGAVVVKPVAPGQTVLGPVARPLER